MLSRRSGSDYAVALMALLPSGRAWPRDADSALGKLTTGLSQIMGYFDGRAADLLEIESDPRKTDEMLADWERNWGLPDECIQIATATEAERRAALVAKMTLMGGQSRNFFIALAATRGETNINIREYAPYMCGVSRVGDTRVLATTDSPGDPNFRWQLGPPEMRFYWRISVGDVLSGVECLLNRYRPAHSQLVVDYDNVLDRSVGMYVYTGV